jgi:hypothetical protein
MSAREFKRVAQQIMKELADLVLDAAYLRK